MNDRKDHQNQTSERQKTVHPPSQKSELLLRVVFGLLLAAVAFYLTWLGGLAFQIFAAIIAFVMFYEYRRICGNAIPIRIGLISFAFLALNIAAWISKAYDTAIILTIFAGLSLWAWEAVIKRSGWGAMGLIYVLLPYFGLVHIRGASDEGFHAVLLLFACVWGADTMAYFVGKTLGGPKLMPKISPGKTWSGFFGGLVGGVIISWIVLLICGYWVKPAFFALSTLLVISSQIGDLAESALKRKFNVKDSGTIIPGHGGILDRIDGLIFATIVAWIIALWVSNVFFGDWTWEPAFALMSAIATH